MNRCSICKDSKGTKNHILINCDRTKKLWNLILAILGWSEGDLFEILVRVS